MAGVSKARADVSARIATFTVIFAALLAVSGGQRSWAQTPAPIVYAKAPSANMRLANRVEFTPVSAQQSAPLSFNQFEGRAPASPIDLRPGATKASFGPAQPIAPRAEPMNSLASVSSSTRAPMAFAEPYAGPPYQVAGKWYVPTHEPNYDEVGIASWYGPTFHGKASATGEVFDENAMTAAHPTLPIPSLVRVTNLENGRSVVVRLNDRGPFVDDRIIDMSRAAGIALDMQKKGTAKVRVQYSGPAPVETNTLPVQPVRRQPTVAQVSAPEPLVSRSPPEFSLVAQPLPPLVPAPAAPAPVRVQNQRGYLLQAGSYADLGNAHSAMRRLEGLGPVAVVEAAVDGSTYYRVMVGPWASRPEAEQAKGRLTEAGTKAFVVARLD